MNTRSRWGIASSIFVAAFTACGDGDGASGVGELRIEISGEEASREGYPVGSGDDEIAFIDGWTLEFTKVLVSLTDFTLRTSDGDDAELDAEAVVADLHLGEPRLWSFEGVPARRWDRVGYRYAPPTAGARKANEVDDADLERMADEGYSLLIAATAKKDGRSVELEYGFAFRVDMTECVNGQDETDGVVVANNAVNQAQITVHLDHLFFDSYASDEANLRFDPMAAVAPASGPLTLGDLSSQSNLSDMKDAAGAPLDIAYDPGSAFVPVPRNLEDYVMAAATTTGHWNGEGHCVYDRK
jgi:hypothetical protein